MAAKQRDAAESVGRTHEEELREIERCVYREILPQWIGEPPHPERVHAR